MDGATPLRAWRGTELRAVEQRLGEACAAWAESWGLESPPRPACSEARDVQVRQSHWQALGTHGPGGAWYSAPADWAQSMSAALFGAEAAPGPLATAVAGASSTDLLQRAHCVLDLRPGEPHKQAPPSLHAWAGAVQAELPFGLRLLLEASVVDALLGATGGTGAWQHRPFGAELVAPLLALETRRLRLRVELAGCELGLGALQDLQPGDVVRLGHRLDEPSIVTDTSGHPLFGGFLARTESRKSVELSPLAGH